MRELAAKRPRWGYERLHILLKREGRLVNHKLVLRLYREEGLAVARRRRQKRVSVPRVPLPAPCPPKERWSMDFVTDAPQDQLMIYQSAFALEQDVKSLVAPDRKSVV